MKKLTAEEIKNEILNEALIISKKKKLYNEVKRISKELTQLNEYGRQNKYKPIRQTSTVFPLTGTALICRWLKLPKIRRLPVIISPWRRRYSAGAKLPCISHFLFLPL